VITTLRLAKPGASWHQSCCEGSRKDSQKPRLHRS
jgi:hypothetical protein